MKLIELLQKRRSIRKYTDEHISEEKLNYIIQAGLMVPSSRGIDPVELILVKDKAMLEKLSVSKKFGAQMLKDADAAVVVIADTEKSDVWMEDCSISMTAMMLAATECNVGNCWVQIYKRMAENDVSGNEMIRELLGYPQSYETCAILSLGIPAQNLEAHKLPELSLPKIHKEMY